MKKRFLISLCLILAIVGIITSCSFGGNSNNGENNDNKLSAEEIYEKVSPSVVTITAESPSAISYGTGFFYKDGSTIVTNYHVIQDCSTASITLTNGKKYDVLTVLGYDKNKDIAILKVDYKNGTPLELRTSEVKTGESVYAIGNSLGFLEGSLSEGIVSTAKREVDGQTYIQTTASVTHGNSGGPLIDSYGKVIGIVSAGFGDGLDLNLAIPISKVATVSTSNPTKLEEIINVEWISNRQVWHQDDNERYVLVFTLSDANENPVAVPGWVMITITNDYNEVVYEKLHKFSVDSFQYWYYDNYTVEKYQATIYIKDSDIESGYCTNGTLTFKVSGSDYSFDDCSLSVHGLPEKSIYNDTVVEKTVYTAQEFVDSISHNRKIILGAKYYDFSNVDISKNAHLQAQTYGRKGFVINGVYNLSIEGEAELVIGDLSSVVLSFSDCSKLSLKGLTVGHTKPSNSYSCEGAVVYLNACEDVAITQCKLFGCGSIGIDADNTTKLVVTSTEIYDCTYTGISLLKSSATFEKCKVYDLSSYSVCSFDNSTVVFSNSTFTETDVTKYGWDKCFIELLDFSGESSVSFNNCSISNNNFAYIVTDNAKNIVFKNCNFKNNSVVTMQNGLTFTNCQWDKAPTKSPRDVVIDWLTNNYVSYENNVMTFSAYTEDIYYVLEYNTKDQHLYIGSYWQFEDGAKMFLLLTIDANPSGYDYTASYEYSSYKNNIKGELAPSTFTVNTVLTPQSYEGNYWNKDTMMRMYSSGFANLIEFFEWCLSDNQIGVTLSDFGFTKFN